MILPQLIFFGLAGLLCGFTPASAQQPMKMARIGILSPQSAIPGSVKLLKAFLNELNWIEEKNAHFEYRYASGDLAKLSEFAADLVRLKVDVIVAGPDNSAAIEAKRATSTIPIVMVGVVDPVGLGLVRSLTRSGGNVTGVTWEITREQAGKNLEILKDAAPKISRVVILRNPNDSTHSLYSTEATRVGKTLGITIRFAELQTASDKSLEHVLNSIVKERANAFVPTPSAFFTDRRLKIIDFAARNQLPAIYYASIFVNDGGLMSYGPNSPDVWRRAAAYVDHILNGANPAELPVERPRTLELMVNLKTANQIGLTIPPNVLARADKVIR